MHRQLALRIKADWHRNGRIVRRLRDLDVVGARIAEHLRAGADQVVLSVLSADPLGSLPVQQWRQLAEALISLPGSQRRADQQARTRTRRHVQPAAQALDADADQLTGPSTPDGHHRQ